MRTRAAIVASSALLFGVAAGFVACGTARPPDAGFDSDSGLEGGTSTLREGGTSTATNPGRNCADDSKGFKEPSGPCTCTVDFGNPRNTGGGSILTVTIPCGATLCTESRHDAVVCSKDGTITVVDNVAFANCAEAGAGALDSLPPCDAGALTPDASDASDGG